MGVGGIGNADADGALPWIHCDLGPLADTVLQIEWPWPVPPSIVWLARLDDGRVVGLGPDENLLNLVARRARDGGQGWVPYRRLDDVDARQNRSDPRTPWHYRWSPADAGPQGDPDTRQG